MKVRVPDYFDRFSCLAGTCPHSCCIGWEVVIDEETAQRYQAASGALGDRLRAALRRDADGDPCFPLNGGRCPFLNAENLCDIHCAWGAEATSVTCQEHPRFTEDYGAFREITLSASCSAANALLLASDATLTFLEQDDGAPAEEGDPWLNWLLPLRDRMLAILRDRHYPLPVRLRTFLRLAQEAQLRIDDDEPETISELAVMWEERPIAADDAALRYALRFLAGLEVLEPDWRDVLQRGEQTASAAVPEPLLERIVVYFAFRYLLKAVNDGDLLGRAAFCVFAVAVLRRLAGVCGISEALRRFSCEIEHDEDNLNSLLDAFAQEELLSPERIAAAL